MVTEAHYTAGWQPFPVLHWHWSWHLQCKLKITLSLALYMQLSPNSLPHPFSGSYFHSLSPLPTNLSLLFYLPEGEWFWITGLINKVNTDRQPLTQHCADRVEKGRSIWGPSVCKGKLFECVHLLTLEFCTVSAESWRLQEKCAQHFQFSDPKLWPVNKCW